VYSRNLIAKIDPLLVAITIQFIRKSQSDFTGDISRALTNKDCGVGVFKSNRFFNSPIALPRTLFRNITVTWFHRTTLLVCRIQDQLQSVSHEPEGYAHELLEFQSGRTVYVS
jgi:hypothetical protein